MKSMPDRGLSIPGGAPDTAMRAWAKGNVSGPRLPGRNLGRLYVSAGGSLREVRQPLPHGPAPWALVQLARISSAVKMALAMKRDA